MVQARDQSQSYWIAANPHHDGDCLCCLLGLESRLPRLRDDDIYVQTGQLGLFGWGKKPNHGKDIHAADSVSVEIKSALEEVAENGAVTCAALWAIANRLGAERKAVSAACDTLRLKIRVCQLGAF